MVWNSEQYDRISSPRLRPALELLDRIEIDDPRLVYDLGCGTGEITVLLAERYRAARVVGLDSSENMLEEARKRAGSACWEETDIDGWKPPIPVDLVLAAAGNGELTLIRRALLVPLLNRGEPPVYDDKAAVAALKPCLRAAGERARMLLETSLACR